MAIKWICGGHRFFSKSQDINNLWKEIMPLTATEICRLIGYDETNVGRLTQLYKKLTFENQGEEEYFLSLIYNQSGLRSLRAFINPHVLYSGSNYERVKVVGELAVK